MRCIMRKPSEWKVRRYAAGMIDLNGYLADLPGAMESDKIDKTKFN